MILHKSKIPKKPLYFYQVVFLVGYFDGMTQQGQCGCTVFLQVSEMDQIQFHWYGGSDTNNRVGILALYGILYILGD